MADWSEMGEMTMRDRKFGYHWIWMLPLFLITQACYVTPEHINRMIHRRRIRKILRDNPEARRMSELAGIRQK